MFRSRLLLFIDIGFFVLFVLNSLYIPTASTTLMTLVDLLHLGSELLDLREETGAVRSMERTHSLSVVDLLHQGTDRETTHCMLVTQTTHCMLVRETDRGRDREQQRQKQRQRDKNRQRQRQTETERQRQRQRQR